VIAGSAVTPGPKPEREPRGSLDGRRIIASVIDQSTEFGARVATHLREDPVVWLTSVSPSGAPLPTPVWFLWDGDRTVSIYSLPTATRLGHIATNPRVSLNFPGDAQGGDIVVFSGRAEIDIDAPPADRFEPYVTKYATAIEGIGLTPHQFGERYSAALRVELTRVRGH
jgi:PPOX class probable F420-dependent enzyme